MIMQRVRLQRLIEAYGADPARWPAAEREAAERLLAASPDLTAAVNEARRLDGALDDYGPAARVGSETRLERALADLPPQQADGVAASGPSFIASVLPRAAVLAAASVAGIFIGLSDIEGPGATVARVDIVTLISEPAFTTFFE